MSATLPPLPCNGSLTTFVPIARSDNAVYCGLTGAVCYMIVVEGKDAIEKYARAISQLRRKQNPLPNSIILIEPCLVILWSVLLIGDLLNSTCETPLVSYASNFSLAYMIMHSLYLSQISLLTARLFTISRLVATLSIPTGFSHIETMLVLKSIASPIAFAINTFGHAGNLFLTWGNYNRQWIVEVSITVLILIASIWYSIKYQLMKNEKIQAAYLHIGIMLVEPIASMIFDTIESELKIWSPPMAIWKLMEFLVLRSSLSMTTRVDRSLNYVADSKKDQTKAGMSKTKAANSQAGGVSLPGTTVQASSTQM